jgi:hypothetical protein
MEHPAFSGIIRDHPEVQEVVVLTEHQDSAEVQDLKLKHLGHREHQDRWANIRIEWTEWYK